MPLTRTQVRRSLSKARLLLDIYNPHMQVRDSVESDAFVLSDAGTGQWTTYRKMLAEQLQAEGLVKYEGGRWVPVVDLVE